MTKNTQIAFIILKLVLPKHDRENLYNNFEALYESELQEKGSIHAQLWLWGQILRSLPGLISAVIYWRYTMLKNYLKTSLRNMARNKLYSILNVSGLSIGLACFILIGLYIIHEKSYDRFHSNARNIYRVVKTSNLKSGVVRNSATVPSLLATSLESEYPGLVKDVVRFWHYWGLGFNVQYKDNIFKEINFAFADSTVFNIFDFEFLVGNPDDALSAAYNAVITESIASKYFGDENPIGKSLRINDGYDIHVTGIVKDLPSQSHFHFDFLTAYSTLNQMPWKRYLDNWREDFCYTYLLLNDGFSAEMLNEKFPAFFKKYLPPELKERDSFFLQPLVNIHLKSNLEDEIEIGSQTGNIQIYVLFSIALFILIIAIINYINMTTAYYSVRVKEIGVRKVLGSQRSQLIFQFLGESAIVCLLSLALSLAIVKIILPLLSNLVGKSLSLSLVPAIQLLVLLISLGVFISIISGTYPAFFVSGLHPIEVLGNIFRMDMKKGLGRKILVVSQLVLASLLIIGSILIHQQSNYINSYDTKYAKDDIIILPVNMTPIAHDHYDAFLNMITQHPAIVNASGMRTVIGFEHIKEPFSIKSNPASQQMIPFYLVRHNFVETFGVKIVAGRDFSKKYSTDETEAVLINQTMARQLDWSNEEAIGQQLNHPGWGELKVIGVINDFNFESLHSTIKPLVIKLIWPWRQAPLTDYIAVRMNTNDIKNTIQFIGDTWKKFAPNSAFDYYFLDKKLDQFYRTEAMLSKASSLLTILAIVLACFGLLGLISFITKRKTKEIALRKVMGASVAKIVGLISKEFFYLIIIANLIAFPIAYIAINIWLQNFAYRIHVSVWIFALAALIIFFTSFLAILFHTLKAAYTNSVDYLRYE
jgi:putative ABC transport system permease protein